MRASPPKPAVPPAPVSNPCSAQEPLANVAMDVFLRGATSDTFTAATWNLNRIPFARFQQHGYRKNRQACQSKVLSAFDVDAMQERFLPVPQIPGHPYVTDRIDRTTTSIDPLRFRTRHHGLALASRLPLTQVSEGHYAQCAPNMADCLASKGFIVAQMQTNGGPVWVVTTHLDAGDAPEDKRVRATQIAELEKAVARYSGQPLLLMGDLNFLLSDPVDSANLNGMIARLGLTVHQRQNEKGLDVMASRGLTLVDLLQYDDPSVTDHPLLAGRFRVTQPSGR